MQLYIYSAFLALFAAIVSAAGGDGGSKDTWLSMLTGFNAMICYAVVFVLGICVGGYFLMKKKSDDL